MSPRVEASLHLDSCVSKDMMCQHRTFVAVVAVHQGPAFFLSGETDAEVSAGESGFALAGLIMCSVLFVGYLWYQWRLSQTDNDQVRTSSPALVLQFVEICPFCTAWRAPCLHCRCSKCYHRSGKIRDGWRSGLCFVMRCRATKVVRCGSCTADRD